MNSLTYLIESQYLKEKRVLDPYCIPLNSTVQCYDTLQIAVQAGLDAAFIYCGMLLIESRETGRPEVPPDVFTLAGWQSSPTAAEIVPRLLWRN